MQWAHTLTQYSMFICRHIFVHTKHKHTLSVTPWLVAISRWCFLGNTHWGSWSPIMKDTEMLAEKKKLTKNRHAQRDKHAHMLTHTHTEIDMEAVVSLKRPAVSIFVPEGTCQTPVVTGSKTVPLRSPALSFITWVRARAVCRICFHMRKARQMLFSQTNVCLLIRCSKACYSLIR